MKNKIIVDGIEYFYEKEYFWGYYGDPAHFLGTDFYQEDGFEMIGKYTLFGIFEPFGPKTVKVTKYKWCFTLPEIDIEDPEYDKAEIKEFIINGIKRQQRWEEIKKGVII